MTDSGAAQFPCGENGACVASLSLCTRPKRSSKTKQQSVTLACDSDEAVPLDSTLDIALVSSSGSSIGKLLVPATAIGCDASVLLGTTPVADSHVRTIAIPGDDDGVTNATLGAQGVHSSVIRGEIPGLGNVFMANITMCLAIDESSFDSTAQSTSYVPPCLGYVDDVSGEWVCQCDEPFLSDDGRFFCCETDHFSDWGVTEQCNGGLDCCGVCNGDGSSCGCQYIPQVNLLTLDDIVVAIECLAEIGDTESECFKQGFALYMLITLFALFAILIILGYRKDRVVENLIFELLAEAVDGESQHDSDEVLSDTQFHKIGEHMLTSGARTPKKRVPSAKAASGSSSTGPSDDGPSVASGHGSSNDGSSVDSGVAGSADGSADASSVGGSSDASSAGGSSDASSAGGSSDASSVGGSSDASSVAGSSDASSDASSRSSALHSSSTAADGGEWNSEAGTASTDGSDDGSNATSMSSSSSSSTASGATDATFATSRMPALRKGSVGDEVHVTVRADVDSSASNVTAQDLAWGLKEPLAFDDAHDAQKEDVDESLSSAAMRRRAEKRIKQIRKLVHVKFIVEHSWASCFFRRPYSKFTRPQRLVIVLMIILVSTFTNALFYRSGSVNLLQGAIQTVLASLAAIPPAWVAIQLFERRKWRKWSVDEQLVLLDLTRRIWAKEHGGINKVTNTMVEHDRAAITHRYHSIFPQWFDILGYIWSACWIFASAFFILVYGIGFESDVHQAWLISSIISVLQDALVNEPLSLAASAVATVVLSGFIENLLQVFTWCQ